MIVQWSLSLRSASADDGVSVIDCKVSARRALTKAKLAWAQRGENVQHPVARGQGAGRGVPTAASVLRLPL